MGTDSLWRGGGKKEDPLGSSLKSLSSRGLRRVRSRAGNSLFCLVDPSRRPSFPSLRKDKDPVTLPDRPFSLYSTERVEPRPQSLVSLKFSLVGPLLFQGPSSFYTLVCSRSVRSRTKVVVNGAECTLFFSLESPLKDTGSGFQCLDDPETVLGLGSDHSEGLSPVGLNTSNSIKN